MKKLRIGAIILAGVLLLSLLIYRIPQRRQVSMWVCTFSGETAQVEIDLQYYRQFILNDYVKGTLCFNGVTYVDEYSIYDTLWPPQKSDMPHPALSWPKTDLPNNSQFIKNTVTNVLKVNSNHILLWDVSNDFEKLHIMYIDDSLDDGTGSVSGVSYYGPARTVEEAQQIARYFGRPVD